MTVEIGKDNRFRDNGFRRSLLDREPSLDDNPNVLAYN